MAASPLAAALLGGEGGANAFALDPAMVQAMPDIQLGQSMIQQGLSTAPASPWQALARIAQAGAGTYLQHEGIGSLAKAYAHTADNMANVFPAGTPIGDMLRSPDPTVRMIGLQQAGKAALVGSEPYTMSAGQTRMTGRAPIAESTAPQTEAGKATADVRNEADRQATEQATGVTPPAIRVPRAPGVPLAPPRFAPQPGGIESVTGMSPPVPAPVNQPPAQQTSFDDRFNASRPTSVPSNVLQPGIQVGAEQTEANERAKANVEFGDLIKPQPPLKPGPGTTETLTTTHGTLIPPLKEQAALPTSPAEAKPKVEAWQKTTEGWNSSLQAGYQAEQRLNTIANVFKTMQTGWGTEQKAQVAAALKSLGVNLPESILGDPAKVQLAVHENYVETLQQLKAATPRFTQMEFRATSENKEHPDLQPAANLQMLSEDIGQLRQARDLPRDFIEAQQHGWRDPQSFEQAWLRQNPLKGYVDKVRGEIGPLKGMEGNESGKGGAKPPTSGSWTDPKTGKTYQIINGVLHE